MIPSETVRKTCVVVGVGPGNGAAFVRRMVAEGYFVAMIARSHATISSLATDLSFAKAYVCDVRKSQDLQATMTQILSEFGSVGVLIYNAGKGVWGDIGSVNTEGFKEAWETNVLGAVQAVQSVLPGMKSLKSGNIIFIGATASLRGGAKSIAFAAAKAAQRSLAQSVARSEGPSGIHTSLIIVDGIVDEPLMRARFSERPDSFFVKPDDIADTIVTLINQKPSAWSFELKARPFAEPW